MPLPVAGAPAPDLDLPTDGGGRIHLADLAGRPVVLYFYPKDDTSGCTSEAKDFSALADDFAALGAVVVGLSPDAVASHDKFKAKHGLAVVLASDETKEVLSAYGVWGEKSMYGRKFLGVTRTTVLVDADGRVAKVWPRVKVAGHARAVLEAVQALGTGA